MTDRAHVTDSELSQLHEGGLDASARAGIETHLASCDACRSRRDETEATRREGPGAAPTRRMRPSTALTELARKPAQLARGTALGRYLILEVLGEGGMGVVYSAYDPELDRKVAIKLLQPELRSSALADPTRLVREAQALARLSHPNVIAVHDVGTLPDDRVFIAMELVDGETLRRWLRAQPRSWREVVAVMLGAGSGLAAAHAAGLVHRDFKPDNVLVGRDGRVRVMDFGLARLQRLAEEEPRASRDSDLQVEARSPLSAPLTVAGTVLGTPAYIAPEIYREQPADERADQFSFGVTMYEALFGIRPYHRKDLRAGVATPMQPPTPARVPAPIQRVVMRAIAIDPAARYPTMDALLAELAIDPDAARRRRLVGGGAAAAAAAIAIAAGVAMSSAGAPSREPPCRGIDRRLAGIWDDAARREIGAAFGKATPLFGARAFAVVERALDTYATAWATTATESCEATRIRGTQTEDVLTLRQGCLDQRLEELRAVAGVFRNADATLVERAETVVAGLEPVRRCSNIELLRAPERATDEQQARLRPLLPKLADAKAALGAGQFLAAGLAVRALVDGSKEAGFEPALAEALLLRGTLLLQLGKGADAVTALTDAVWSAMRGRREDIVATAALAAAQASAQFVHKPAEARIWLGLAAASATRIGVDPKLEQKRLEVLGIIEAESGNLPAAIAAHEQALVLATRARDDGPEGIWANEQMLGSTLAKSGAWIKALPHFERALALREAMVGPEHPDIALILSMLGASYNRAGERAKARAAYGRALAIRERAFGPDSPRLAVTLNNYAHHQRTQGNHVDALAAILRAKQIVEKAPGTAHPMYHTIATTHAETLHTAGRLAEARAAFDAVLALEEQTRSPVLATTLASRASLAVAEKQWTAAAAFAERAIAGFEASGGSDNPELGRPLTTLAEARLALRRPADARALVERALAIGAKANASDTELAPTRAVLARLPSR